MKGNGAWKKLGMVVQAAVFAALAESAEAATEAAIALDGGNRLAPSSAESLSDGQFLDIARRKADGFAAQGDFEQANRVMEQAQREVERRRGSAIPDNIPDSLKDLYARASHGDPEAQFSWSRKCMAAKNYQEAVKWLRKAAEQGHPLSQCTMGLLCHSGMGVPPNDLEAVQWYRLAADQGDSMGQYHLAILVFNGIGCEANGALAMELFQKAGSQKNDAEDEIHALACKMADDIAEMLNGWSNDNEELLGPNCAEALKKFGL